MTMPAFLNGTTGLPRRTPPTHHQLELLAPDQAPTEPCWICRTTRNIVPPTNAIYHPSCTTHAAYAEPAHTPPRHRRH